MGKIPSSVFVSHAASDKENVLKLVDYLKASLPGVTFYVSSSYQSLKPGTEWWADITSTLATSTVVLACISRQSVNKPWILFESGVGVGTGATVIPVILDDLPYAALGAPLSMYQAVRVDKDGLFNLVKMIATKTNTRAKLETLAKRPLPNFAGMSQRAGTLSGIYLGSKRVELNGWHAYKGDPRNFERCGDYISIGKSFDDGFKYPASDLLEAPWRFWGFRIKRTQEMHIYAAVRLLDGQNHLVYVTTNANVWGFEGKYKDEFMVPAPFIPRGEWQVVVVNMMSVESKLESPIQAITGFLARGPLMLSHIWCVDEVKQIPKRFRDDAEHLVYPGVAT
jgi:hypothetical protein